MVEGSNERGDQGHRPLAHDDLGGTLVPRHHVPSRMVLESGSVNPQSRIQFVIKVNLPLQG